MKILKLGKDARDAIKRGIDLVASHTNPTLGPSGRASLLGRIDLPPRLADDAVSIVMNIESEDETEQMGVMLMREALMTQSKNIKDTTATTMNLSQSVTNAVFEKLKDEDVLVKSNVNTIDLYKELNATCELIVAELSKNARPMTTEEIYDVALSAGSYEWIARLVTDVFTIIGKDGYVSIEEGLTTSFEILNGMDIKSGYHSEYYINNDDKECVLDNPYVLVTNQRLDTEAIKRVIGILLPKDIKSAIFIAPDFTPETLVSMVKTHENGQFTPVALKLPTFDKDDILIDIATLTGANLLDRKIHTSYDSFLTEITLSNLGTVNKAIICDNKSKLIGGLGNVTSRIQEIKAVFDKTDSAFDKDVLSKRIAALAGAVAYIKVGGVSDFEKEYSKLKIENAVGSVQNALKGNVVKGGGVALKEVADGLPINILSEAIKSPYKQIQVNNGEPFVISDKVIDPLINVIGALRTACSIAGRLLLIESTIAFKLDKKYESKN